jgi:uncharacterized Fe-S cluster protein YjdI/CDGSH-type Zn-finger protein
VARRRIQHYATDEIEVTFDPSRCIHYAACIRRLPAVFEAAARPWIRPEAAPPEEIAEAVRACPTGALHYRLLRGGAAEQAEEARVRVLRDGPVVISGDVVVALEDGTEVVHDTRVALCRCGKSGNMPFCDNTHRAIGWRDAAGDAAGDAARASGPEVRSEAASLEDGPRLA